ncbi:MAG: hypothetical protein AVDCRST_MAG18-4408 [uncultured Thermomicrobiales bacterium]|uniref:DUF2071 domain-containing protein n=1 Tax=uncultured Thermomicrobiales bacterium TaxID=1645740 RepID=A0A6J4VUP4_9BACT|nr:MAG: hypothetical protein AVDCRST_MAG18-4408 [uncultured Thermomicrobiales bacterium]
MANGRVAGWWRAWRASTPPFAADHRPWTLPDQPFAMWQVWRDLLFAHWPVPPEMLRQTIPAGLDLDLFEGQAWVGVVPFRMSGIRLRGQPVAAPWLGAFPELNVRTYVTAPGGARAGVYFYSLDAGNPVAVALARRWYHLPYFFARMRVGERAGWIEYDSWRVHPGAARSRFRGRYRPLGEPYRAAPDSLEAWLTERYALYTADRQGRPLRGEIHHLPWPLQRAEAELQFGALTAQHGIVLPDRPPLLHFARRLDIVAWTLTPFG